MARSTKVETEQRIEQVYKLLLGGAAFPDIREFASAPEQNWNVSDKQIRRYMTAAHERIQKYAQAKEATNFALALLRRDQLYAHAMGAGDFRTALAVDQDRCKLLGLYAPLKVAPTNPEGTLPYAPLSDSERAAALALLHAALGAGSGGQIVDGTDGSDGSLLVGPGADTDRCWLAARPVASRAAADGAEPDPSPLFAPER
jgi:hypothetical protein